MTTVYIVDQYTELIREAAKSKGSSRVILMKQAFAVLDKMDYRAHQDLIEQAEQFSLLEINMMLGSGLKEPAREVFLMRAAKLEQERFGGY